MNMIILRYTEKTYSINYKGNTYKLSIIEDWEIGDYEVVIMKYNKAGELVPATEKQRAAVLEYFNDNTN